MIRRCCELAWLLPCVVITSAMAGAPTYSTTWSTIDAGGFSSDGPYGMRMVIGQPDAETMTGGSYSLRAGYIPAPPSMTTPCPGDATGDGSVNFTDLNEVLNAWGTSVPVGTMGDVTGDGMVNFEDLNEVLEYWATDC